MNELELAIQTFKENEELKEKIKELEEKVDIMEIRWFKLKRYLWNEQEEDIYVERGIKTKTNYDKTIKIQYVLDKIAKLEGIE
mgnify:CR=1 FL=1